MGRRGRCRIEEGWRVSVTEREIVVRTRRPPLLTSLRPRPSRRTARQAHLEEQAAGAISLGLWQNNVDRPPVHMQRGDRPTLTRAAGSVKAPPPEGTSSRGQCWCVGTRYGAYPHLAPDDVRLYSGHAEEHAGGPPRSHRITSVEQPTRASVPGLASPPRSRPRQNAPSTVAGERVVTHVS